MSTLESTISLLEMLPETDVRKVGAFIKKFFLPSSNRDGAIDVASYNPYKRLSSEELFNSLEESRKRAADGHVMDANQVAVNVRAKYGL